MPSLLHPDFAPLIRTLPVKGHSFEVFADFWRPKFLQAGQAALYEAIFQGKSSIRITRGRLRDFEFEDPSLKCAEILLWGYPSDQRGRVSALLPVIHQLPKLAASEVAWRPYFDAFASTRGIGISTISKLAYFHGRVFDGHGALILDARVMENAARWTEVSDPVLSRPTARTRYSGYLRSMNAIAARIECTPCQLELFLFALGGNY